VSCTVRGSSHGRGARSPPTGFERGSRAAPTGHCPSRGGHVAVTRTLSPCRIDRAEAYIFNTGSGRERGTRPDRGRGRAARRPQRSPRVGSAGSGPIAPSVRLAAQRARPHTISPRISQCGGGVPWCTGPRGWGCALRATASRWTIARSWVAALARSTYSTDEQHATVSAGSRTQAGPRGRPAARPGPAAAPGSADADEHAACAGQASHAAALPAGLSACAAAADARAPQRAQTHAADAPLFFVACVLAGGMPQRAGAPMMMPPGACASEPHQWAASIRGDSTAHRADAARCCARARRRPDDAPGSVRRAAVRHGASAALARASEASRCDQRAAPFATRRSLLRSRPSPSFVSLAHVHAHRLPLSQMPPGMHPGVRPGPGGQAYMVPVPGGPPRGAPGGFAFPQGGGYVRGVGGRTRLSRAPTPARVRRVASTALTRRFGSLAGFRCRWVLLVRR
jgi:hypothetical protein